MNSQNSDFDEEAIEEALTEAAVDEVLRQSQVLSSRLSASFRTCTEILEEEEEKHQPNDQEHQLRPICWGGSSPKGEGSESLGAGLGGGINNKKEEPNDQKIPNAFEPHNKDTPHFRCRTIVFTCFNEDAVKDPQYWLETFLFPKVKWCMGQLEKCPKSGKQHIQGMCYSNNPQRFAFLEKIKCWKQSCRSPLDSINYCSKSETKLDGPWEFGTRPTWNVAGEKKNRVEKNIESLKNINSATPEELLENGEIHWTQYKALKMFKTTYGAQKRINEQLIKPLDHSMPHQWIYGPTGSGKTTKARDENPGAYIKSKNKWWDEYNGEDVIIIEDLGKTDAVWMGDMLKIWADKWSFKAEIKGSQVHIRPRKVVVTSNYTIRDLWIDENIYKPLERRFEEIYISD